MPTLRFDFARLLSAFALAAIASLSIPHLAAQTESVIYSFSAAKRGTPLGALVFDSSGNLYGTAAGSGENSGMVFELEAPIGSVWTVKALHTFNGTNGAEPNGAVVFDAEGNL